MKVFRAALLALVCGISLHTFVYASATLGTIDPNNLGSYTAQIENAGLGSATSINFGKFTTQSAKNITVSDSELRGFAWGEGVGWIVTNCADTTSGCSSTNNFFKIANDGSGNLSGFAWGENTGWINFGPFTNPAISTVKITSGIFGGTLGSAGYAWSQNFGFIKFDCASTASCVKTDWGVTAATYQCNDGVDNDGDGLVDYPADPGCSSPTDDSEYNGTGGGGTVQCNDGIDNDNDGLIDYPADPGCSSPTDTSEEDPIVPPDLCGEPAATNYDLPGECTFYRCDKVLALNYNHIGACIFDVEDIRCQNPIALNYLQPGACIFPVGLICDDQKALNFNMAGECEYSPDEPTCDNELALNYGEIGTCRYHTYCELHPGECFPPDGPTKLEKIEGAVASVLNGAIGTTLKFVGIVAVGAGGVALSLVGTQFTFYSLILWLMRLWALLLVALGIKKKSKPWGTVYDSVTKQPIDPAYVVLMDMEGNEVATSITDIEGRYGFAVPAGTYTLIANKTNYEFPSKVLAGKTADELYDDLYFGGTITVLEEDGLITKNIPLDQLNFDWNEYAKNEQHRLRHYKRQDVLIARISNTLFIVGFIITAISTLVVASVFNIVLMSLYVLMVLARVFKFRTHPKGSVADTATGSVLPFSVVRVVSTATNKEIAHKVAGATGKYYALLANGTYRVVVDRKNADQSYTPVSIPDDIAVTKGYLKKDFKI